MTDLHPLLQGAADEGDLGPVSISVMKGMDLTPVINNALGTSPVNVNSTEVVLLSFLLDDSGSIAEKIVLRDAKGNPVNDPNTGDPIIIDNVGHMISGVNLVLDAQLKAKSRDAILVHIALLNGGLVCEYRPLEGMIRLISKEDLVVLYRQKEQKVVYEVEQVATELGLSPEDVIDRIGYGERVVLEAYNGFSETWYVYWPTGGTPLYKESISYYATVVAKTQEFRDVGIAVRSIELTATDGQDLHSGSVKAKDVAAVVGDMLSTERHIVAAMGIRRDDTDFRSVFKSMGIRDQWILTPDNSPKEIRAAFLTFSQSAQRASQSAANFSQSSVGGFGSTNP